MTATTGMAQEKHPNIVIEGLRKIHDDQASEPTLFKVELQSFAVDAPISEIWTRLEELGYENPHALCNIDFEPDEWSRSSTKRISHSPCEVTVVGPEERSDYHRNIININDTLISFANQPYQDTSQLNFKLQPESLEDRETGAQMLSVNNSLEIVFHRTLRMPDDDRLHQLPSSLGKFPLFNVEEYASRLTPTIADQGGIFFPMWQREAMWIGFKVKDKRAGSMYAVRISIGRINAITGLPMNEAKKKDENGEFKQDYIVVPQQAWVDGICVAAGVVRQFVAMPLGSGYSVEGQITGEEKFGGLQIEVIPSYRRNLKEWAHPFRPGVTLESAQNEFDFDRFIPLDEYKSPAALGYKISDKLRVYPVPSTAEVPLRISDIAEKFSSDRICLRAKEMKNESSSDEVMGSDLFGCPPRAGFIRHKRMRHRNDERRATAAPPSRCGFNPTTQAKPRSLRAMGLAAGGRMIQDIVRDKNAATAWNTQNAKLMNVHILDPASCEQVTHVVPAPPPMDAQTYTDANLPFFVVEEDVDNRLDEGNFGQVDSVSGMDKKIGVSTEPEFDPNKPKMCKECSLRLCDCIIRPCEHQFCNVCIRKLENIEAHIGQEQGDWRCPRCDREVQHVAGFSAPMNLPGEERLKVKVPVRVLKATEDGRPEFQSMHPFQWARDYITSL